jgi:hypothetical protein
VSWTTVNLSGTPSWEPARLVAPVRETWWPTNRWPLAPIGELVSTVVAATALAEPDQPVVTPAGISRDDGHVASTKHDYSGRVYHSGTATDALAIGDLLVSPYPAQPALLIGPDHDALAFAGTFHALRPIDSQVGIWLWAVLSSSTGSNARYSEAVGGIRPLLSRGRLLELVVPMPPLETLHVVTQRVQPLLGPSQRVSTRAGEIDRSWWRTDRLPRNSRWDFYVTLPDPQQLFTGTPLGELCHDVKMGRDVHDVALPIVREGWVPVFTSRSVRHDRADQLWVAPGQQLIYAEPGDVLIPAVGLSARSHACRQLGVVDRDVIRCRLHRPEFAASVVHFLNADAGQSLRRMLVAGIIPRLTVKTVGLLSIPDEALLEGKQVGSAEDETAKGRGLLADQLDRVLWS